MVSLHPSAECRLHGKSLPLSTRRSTFSSSSLSSSLSFSLLVLLVIFSSFSVFSTTTTTPAAAFTFKIEPGKRKCFTESLEQDERIQLHYRMHRSLSPFVSVGFSAPGGVPLMQHEPAHEGDNKTYFHVRNDGTYAICFNSNEKAKLTATSFDILLEINDADDAELTRNRKSKYSTSQPLGLGVGKTANALKQAEYVFARMGKIRASYAGLIRSHEEITLMQKALEVNAWDGLLSFVGVSTTLVVLNMAFLRYNLKQMKVIK